MPSERWGGWRLICCQLSLRWRRWKGDMWEWINAWMQRWSIRCSLILWASELNRMHRLLLALSRWMLSPSGITSNCRVSRSEVHFSTANISPHKYWQCIPSCRLHWKSHLGLDVGNDPLLCPRRDVCARAWTGGTLLVREGGKKQCVV